jgi:hypothetical protein
MKSNSKEVTVKIRAHILECVYNETENPFKTFEEAKNHLKSEFERVSNHAYNLQKFPNEAKRFCDYLQGLPFWFLFYSEEVNDFLNSLGINPNNKKYNSEVSFGLYSNLIFNQLN